MEERYKQSNKTYCLECYNEKNSHKQSQNTLYDTICEYFNISSLTGLMLKQIREYRTQNKYTDDGMVYTLWYCKEILQKTFLSKYGVAIIKYEYENAEQYFLQQLRIAESITEHDEKIKYVTIKLPKNKQKNHLIDIDKIIEGSE